MTQSAQLRTSIENTKENISQTVNALEDRLQGMKDWRTIVQEHPITSLLVSAGVGLLFSGALSGEKTGKAAKFAGGYLGQIATATVSGLLIQQAKQAIQGPTTTQAPTTNSV